MELIASEDVGISRNPKYEVLVSNQEGKQWGEMVEPCGHQEEAPSWAEKAASAKAMRWECAWRGQGVPREAVCPDGREKGQAMFRPQKGFEICSKQDGSHQRILGCQRLIPTVVWRRGGVQGGVVSVEVGEPARQCCCGPHGGS